MASSWLRRASSSASVRKVQEICRKKENKRSVHINWLQKSARYSGLFFLNVIAVYFLHDIYNI